MGDLQSHVDTVKKWGVYSSNGGVLRRTFQRCTDV